MRAGPYSFLDDVVSAYHEAIRKDTGKSVEEVRWGKRVKSDNVMDMVRVEEIMPSDHIATDELEEFPDADADDLELEGFESDLEHFEDDEEIQPDIVHEVR